MADEEKSKFLSRREAFDKDDTSLQTLSEIRESIKGADIPTAGIVGGISAIFARAKEVLGNKRINLDDLKRITNEMRKEFTDKRDKKILERAKAKVGDKGMKAGGLVKGKKKSVKPKKKSVAGRLAKRGYGAARK